MSSNKAKLEALLKLINSATQDAIAEYEKTGNDVPSIDSTKPHPLDDALDHKTLDSAVRTLEGACAQLCTTLATPSHTAVNLVLRWDTACIRVALQENITDVLMDYPEGLHVDELSRIVDIDAQKLARLLRLLATKGCYTEVAVNTFANNRLSLVLHSENPVRYMVGVHAEATTRGAAVLYETLKDPRTARSMKPEDAPVMYANNQLGITGTFFDLMKQQDNSRENYNRAMQAANGVSGSLSVLMQFPFDEYSTVVDVGGGIGAFSLPLARVHKHIKITMQDLPDVLNHARSVWARDFPEAIQENRVEFAELNFFTHAPVKGKDIYYLRNIIHDWPNHEAVLILRNVRQALELHSRVLIHEHVFSTPVRKEAEAEAAAFGTVVAPEPLLPNFGVGSMRMYQLDLAMWLLHNAEERTLRNILDLANTAGLKLEKVWDLVKTRVLEFSAA